MHPNRSKLSTNQAWKPLTPDWATKGNPDRLIPLLRSNGSPWIRRTRPCFSLESPAKKQQPVHSKEIPLPTTSWGRVQQAPLSMVLRCHFSTERHRRGTSLGESLPPPVTALEGAVETQGIRYTKQATVTQQRLSLLNSHRVTAHKKAGQDLHA